MRKKCQSIKVNLKIFPAIGPRTYNWKLVLINQRKYVSN